MIDSAWLHDLVRHNPPKAANAFAVGSTETKEMRPVSDLFSANAFAFFAGSAVRRRLSGCRELFRVLIGFLDLMLAHASVALRRIP